MREFLKTDHFKSILVGIFLILWLWASGNDGLQDVRISDLQHDIRTINAIAADDREDSRIRFDYAIYRSQMIEKAIDDPSFDFTQVKSIKEYVTAGWDRVRPTDSEW